MFIAVSNKYVFIIINKATIKITLWVQNYWQKDILNLQYGQRFYDLLDIKTYCTIS